jgi:DNA-binding transcriptional MerR regulator
MVKNREYSKIEEVAVRTGLTKRALRYYEDLKLLRPVRKASGYRLYAEDDIEKLIRIKEFKESLGFTLDEVKDIMDLEERLKRLFNDKRAGKNDVRRSMERVKKQIQLIESKEKTLERVKLKYKNAFHQLKKMPDEKGEKNS